MKTMKRTLRNLASLAIVLVFAAALLCSTLAVPDQSFASVTGCSENSGAMAMAGCENPSYLCGFGSSSNLFSQGALGSGRSYDLFKKALSLVEGEVIVTASDDGPRLIGNGRVNTSFIDSHKVSIRLFNSILNL